MYACQGHQTTYCFTFISNKRVLIIIKNRFQETMCSYAFSSVRQILSISSYCYWLALLVDHMLSLLKSLYVRVFFFISHHIILFSWLFSNISLWLFSSIRRISSTIFLLTSLCFLWIMTTNARVRTSFVVRGVSASLTLF